MAQASLAETYRPQRDLDGERGRLPLPLYCHLAIASPLYLPSTHSTIRQAAIMAEGMFYNVTAGYIEGIVRGYRNNLLTGQNYGNLTQCETIDGM